MTITEFLEARIAEDEAIGHAAAASVTPAMDASREPVGPAWEDCEGMILGQRDKDGYQIPLWDNEGSSTLSMHPDASAHIARHDPARALAECAAKRAILAEHVPVDYSGLGMESPNACAQCGADLNMSDWDWVHDSFPCPTLRALAAIYADHPDYQQEWK